MEKPSRQVILDAVQELLKEHGYKSMTMEAVAAKAGLGKGTIYLYFESKDDLALSCIDRMNRQLQEEMKAIARSSDPAEKKLETLLKERVLFRLKGVQGHKTGIDDLLFGLRTQLFERRDRYHHEEALLIAEVLIEGRTLGRFEVDEPYEVAQALITATNSLLPYSLSPRELVERIHVERSIDRLAPLLVKSVAKVQKSG
jgi:AcrR family transcriptional regulator